MSLHWAVGARPGAFILTAEQLHPMPYDITTILVFLQRQINPNHRSELRSDYNAVRVFVQRRACKQVAPFAGQPLVVFYCGDGIRELFKGFLYVTGIYVLQLSIRQSCRYWSSFSWRCNLRFSAGSVLFSTRVCRWMILCLVC